MTSAERWQEVGEAGWAWTLGHVRYDHEGHPSIPVTVDDAGEGEPDKRPDGLHSGIAGLALALAEVRLTREWNDAERRLASGIVAALSAHAAERVSTSKLTCLLDWFVAGCETILGGQGHLAPTFATPRSGRGA